MPSCIVKGCNFSWKKKDPNVILHSFPGDLDAIKSWLLATTQATKQVFENIDELCQKILVGKPKGLYRMCSQHFTMDCYYQRGMLISLKKEALPTIFPDKETIELKALRPKMYKPRKKKVPSPNPALVGVARGGIPTSVVMGLPLRVIKLEEDDPPPLSNPCLISEQGYYISPRRAWNEDQNGRGEEAWPPQKKTRTLRTNTEYFPGQRHKAILTDKSVCMRHKEVQTEKRQDDQRACGCQPREESAARLNPSVRTAPSHSKAGESLPTKDRTLELLESQPSGTGLLSNDIPPSRRSKEVHHVGCSHSWSTIKDEKPVVLPAPCPEHNSRREGGHSSVKQESESTGGFGIKAENPDLAKVEIPGTGSSSDSENKYIVFDSCLNKLLMYCRCLADDGCNGRIVNFQKFFVGSSVSVKGECSNGHRFHMWDSQP